MTQNAAQSWTKKAANPAQGGGTNSESVNKSDSNTDGTDGKSDGRTTSTVATATKTATDSTKTENTSTTDADAVAKAKKSIQSIETSIKNIVTSVQQDISRFERDYPGVNLNTVNGFATHITTIESAPDEIDTILVDIDDAPDAKTAQELAKQAKDVEQAVKDAQSEIKRILQEQKQETVDDVSEETPAVASSNNEEWPFTIKMLDDEGYIYIAIYALGTFYYDCGDGKKQTLVVNDFENWGVIECENVAAGAKIKLGGRATQYNNDTAIFFEDSMDEWQISGSLGAIFPTLADGSQPVFRETFSGCKKLSGKIPENLFAGISGPPVERMFDFTFEGCSGLTGPIPEKLFAGLSGAPAEDMFSFTFSGCSGLTGPIPEKLFAGINGAPAEYMFGSTFEGCSGLTGPIPEKLFSGISGAPAEDMFNYTFLGCSKLSGTVGPNFFGTITPPIDAKYVDLEGIFIDTDVTFKE